jgi:alpha-N-arabinofuranosidase
MVYRPEKPGDRAGLVAFHNDRHYYFLAVAHEGGQPVVQLRMRAGSRTPAADSVVASVPITMPAGGRVFLRIEARDGRYDFAYATRENEWRDVVRDADGTILSTRVAGGFVGTMLGMYAQSTPQ